MNERFEILCLLGTLALKNTHTPIKLLVPQDTTLIPNENFESEIFALQYAKNYRKRSRRKTRTFI